MCDQLGGEGGGRCGSGFQRQKVMSSVAGDRGGTGGKQHFLLCAMYFSVLYSSRLFRRTVGLNTLSLNTGST